jgi:hypothetical protein
MAEFQRNITHVKFSQCIASKPLFKQYAHYLYIFSVHPPSAEKVLLRKEGDNKTLEAHECVIYCAHYTNNLHVAAVMAT